VWFYNKIVTDFLLGYIIGVRSHGYLVITGLIKLSKYDRNSDRSYNWVVVSTFDKVYVKGGWFNKNKLATYLGNSSQVVLRSLSQWVVDKW